MNLPKFNLRAPVTAATRIPGITPHPAKWLEKVHWQDIKLGCGVLIKHGWTRKMDRGPDDDQEGGKPGWWPCPMACQGACVYAYRSDRVRASRFGAEWGLPWWAGMVWRLCALGAVLVVLAVVSRLWLG
jgi:hypothetical protein